MSTRPSRSTRSSSTAPPPPPPVTRSTRASAAATNSTNPSTSTSSAALPLRRTTRASRANTPTQSQQQQEIKPVPTRASLAATKLAPPVPRASALPSTSSSSKPLWGRTTAQTQSQNVTPPSKRPSTLAVPGTAARKTPGLLGRMTSRESLRPQQGQQVPKTPAAGVSRTGTGGIEKYDGAREPIKAYLRIRPAPPGVPLQTYVQVLNGSEVLMVPPLDHRLNPSSSSSSIYSNALLRNTSQQRLSNLNLDPSSHPSGVPNDVCASPAPTNQQQHDPASYGALYKFTGVFPSSAASPSLPSSPLSPSSPSAAPTAEQIGLTQSSFFAHTALPLVRSFLEKGENCLLFAYGPTGSGKTHTVQGGQGDEAGLLPRIVEVVWGNLRGKTKPTTPTAAPAGRRATQQPLQSTPVKPSLRGLGAKESLPMSELPEVIPVDEGYKYSIFVSYSEIYNEKIYDLLEAPLPAPAPSTSSTTSLTGGGMLKGLFKNFTTVKRSALSLKADKTASAVGSGTKVVGGLREVRVGSAEEAHRVLHQGQSNRRVFSTLANRASSRSHSIFTIKVVRTPLPSRGGATTAHPEVTSKFSVVDLAGSERVVNTQTTGERLKEAGNINKSLMVLGQCMEVLRKNQERGEGRKPAIVPFRHSKLTEMFQSFFIGEGKAVMIVNINPYSTSYDENSHVMKFSAVARGVMTVQRSGNAVVPLPQPTLASTKEMEEPNEKKGEKKEPRRRESVKRVVRMSLVEGGEEEEVLYEEDESDDDDGGEDEFVNALLDELSALRSALFESQISTALAEANARKRVVQEYEAKMLEMEKRYQDRMRDEAIEAETKLNAKLDILTRLQAAKTPARNAMINRLGSLTPSTVYDDSDEEESEEEEESGVEEGGEEGETAEDGEVEMMLLKGERGADVSGIDSAASPSPLAARAKPTTSTTQHPSSLRNLSSPAASPSRFAALSSAAPAANVLSASTISSPLAALDLEDAAEQAEEEAMEADEQDVEPVAAAAEADASVSHGAEVDSSMVEHPEAEGAEEEEEADESRLTEQTEEEGEEDSVVNLSRLTEDYGGGEDEVSREQSVEGEAEEGEEAEDDEELTELEDEGESIEREAGDDYPSSSDDDAEEAEDDDGLSDFEPSPLRSPSKKKAAGLSAPSSPSKRSTPALAPSATRTHLSTPPADGSANESFDTFSPVKTPGHAKLHHHNGRGREKENAHPEMSTPVNFCEDKDKEGGGEVEEFGERSMVIKSGTKSKKKTRKLGGKAHAVDVDDIDSFADSALSPVRKTGSVRSFKHY